MREPMLSVQDVAGMLGVSIYTIYRLKDKPGGLQAYKVGNRIRFKQEEVDAYLSGQAVEPVERAKKSACSVRFRYVPGMKVV